MQYYTMSNTNLEMNNVQPPSLNMSEGDNIDKNMTADDSQLVDEILTELNNDTPASVENNESIPSALHSDNVMMNTMHPTENEEELPPVIDVEYGTLEQETNGFMKKIKQPLIVLCISFILFNPVVISMLERTLPRVFGSSTSILFQQGKILLLSTILAVLYFATNYLV